MSRHAFARRPLSRFLLLGFGLSLAAHAQAGEDEALRGQRATRRVLRDQAVADDLSDAARAMVRARRYEAIDMLKELLRNATGERRAEMILRLAELYGAEADDLWLEAMAGMDGPSPSCGTEEGPDCAQSPEAVASREWRSKAERLYDQVVRNYPLYERSHEGAWGQAMALLELERPDDALSALIWLVRTHPSSEHAASAYVLIGDHHFDRDRALPALSAYRHSAGYTEAEIRPYALYKQAWCLYNLGDYDQAIEIMRAVALAEQQGVGSVSLQEEARRDLARFFADADDLDGALRFYEGLKRPDLLRLSMERVASHAREQGKAELAVKVLRLLITKLPHEPEAPAWQGQVVTILHDQGREEAALEALEQLVREYGPAGAWARANAGDADALAEGASEVEARLRALAVDWHQQARKLRRGAEAEEAARRSLMAYQAWLARFEDRSEAHELRYAYAELLYQVGQHEQAWLQYREVVERDPAGPRSLFCAESAVFVADEVVGRSARAAGAPPGVEPQPLGTWDQRLLQAVDGYLALVPEGERSRAFATKAAWLHYHRNHFSEAADRFMAVIAMDPGSEEAELAATLILDSLNLVGDYGKLVETSEAFLRYPGLGRRGFDAHLREVHERASFRVIEALLEQDGDRAAAAVAFEAFAHRFPTSDVAHLALHNASVHYRAAGEPYGAIRAASGLVERFPGSEHRTAALVGLGFDHESLADFEGAASWYERLVAEASEHDAAADAMWSAALFRIALGQHDRALEDLRVHDRLWPDHPRQGELLTQVADLHEVAQRHDQAAQAWARVAALGEQQASEGLRAHALVRQGRAMQAAGRGQDARRAWSLVVERWGEDSRGSDLDDELRESVAEALFRLGVEALARYEAIDLGGHAAPSGRSAAQAWVRKQVAAKAAALREVEQAHAAVIEAGAGGWGLTALVRLGGAYEHMADCFREAWVPPWLTSEQAEMYRLELDDEAWRQEEKAAEAYRQAVQRSRALAVYGGPVTEANERLAALRPEERAAPAEDLLKPRYQSSGLEDPAFAREP